MQAIHRLPDEFGSPLQKDDMIDYMATLLVRGLECVADRSDANSDG